MNKAILILVIFALLPACAAKRTDSSIVRLEQINSGLRTEQEQLQRKVEDLSNTILVLQDRMETLKLALERKKETEPAPELRAAKEKTVNARKRETAQEMSERDEAEPFLKVNDPGDSALPPLKLSNKDLALHANKAGSLGSEHEMIATANVGEPSKVVDSPLATRLYNDAYRKFEMQDYQGAVIALENFTHQFPDHAYSDNAIFWVGESYFRMNDYANAISQFERVAREYPTGNKVPDAMLRAGDCYTRLAKTKQAFQVFSRVVELYPKSVAAEKAKVWMNEHLQQPADHPSSPRPLKERL